MTQEELAAVADISVRSIRKIETGGVADPRPSTVRALANAFELSGPDRVVFLEASAGAAEPAGDEPGPAWVPPEPAGSTTPTHNGALPAEVRFLAIVAVDATVDRLDNSLRIEVRVRSAAGSARS